MLKYHIHLSMVKEMVEFLLKRASLGTPTIFAKVKGHSGVTGNDKADRLAAQAREKKNLNPDTHITLDHINNQPRFDQYWYYDTHEKAVKNTNSAIRRLADKHNKAPPTTIYREIWGDAIPYITPESLRYLLSGKHSNGWSQPTMNSDTA